MKVDRRVVLGLGGAAIASAGAAAALMPPPPPPGALRGADLGRGHLLRRGNFPKPSRTERIGVAIIGGGVAGLTAGWTLAEAGYDDFRLFELEDAVGGNARSGRNAVTAYPLGAHYLPLANREAVALRHFLTRSGIITGERDGLPVYDPAQLCADLQERLFWRGRWQEGLVPRIGLGDRDRDDLARFAARMTNYSAMTGRDGRPAFAVPIAYSSADPDLRALDRLTFTDWLAAQGFASQVLRAHVRYAMRDDYGTEPDHVSAWAGIHYFAGRRAFAADDAGDNVLTWPEGNHRLVRALAQPIGDRITAGVVAHRVERTGRGVSVDVYDPATDITTRVEAATVILAVPMFVAARLCPEIGDLRQASYAPWLVANVTVDRLPGGEGVPIAWDNVSTTSDSLGYVVATHQSRSAGGPSVLTWYLPLSTQSPANARRLLIERPADDWKRIVRDDLLAMHPDLAPDIRAIELWRWGHAMVRPVPGYIWTTAPGFRVDPPLYLAHADLSGASLFEEAHYHGTRAAEQVMAQLGHPHVALA